MFNKKTGMYEGYIYLLTNVVNNKKYVGQTTRTIKQRLEEHFTKINKGYAISNAIKLYGKENFKIEELEKINDKSEESLKKSLNSKEIYYIQKYNSMVSSSDGYGYNIDKGGGQASCNKKAVDMYDLNGRYIKTFESQVEASRETEASFDGISRACREGGSSHGHLWTFAGEELKMPKTIPNRPVSKYDLNGKLVQVYNCINDISSDSKLKHRINNCCIGLVISVDGFIYRYGNDSFEKFPTTKKRIFNNRPVNQYSIEQEYLNYYESLKIAENETGVRSDGISDCCRKKIKTSGGFKWFYADDIGQPDKTKIIA